LQAVLSALAVYASDPDEAKQLNHLASPQGKVLTSWCPTGPRTEEI